MRILEYECRSIPDFGYFDKFIAYYGLYNILLIEFLQ